MACTRRKWPPGIVAFGAGAYGVVWVKRDFPQTPEVYVQSFTIPPEVGPGSFMYIVPGCRLVDTRETSTPLVAGEDRVVEAVGHCEILSGARAIAANVVLTRPTSAGNVRFYRPDRLASEVAVVTYGAGDTHSGNTVIALDDAGQFVVRATQRSGSVHLVVDVTGYFQ
jgi:hypothetical protein